MNPESAIEACEPVAAATWPARQLVTATVYCNTAGFRDGPMPDLYAVELDKFHLFEWNLFNSPFFAGKIAYDFDGVLCREWPGNPTGDKWHEVEQYEQFIADAPPLYLPRRDPVPLVVTGRCERHRAVTEDWLAKHRVRVDHLVMWPGSEHARWEQVDGVANIVRFKAEHFRQSGRMLFVESSEDQAKGIAKLAGKPVLCPAAGRVF